MAGFTKTVTDRFLTTSVDWNEIIGKPDGIDKMIACINTMVERAQQVGQLTPSSTIADVKSVYNFVLEPLRTMM